ncbi:MAG: VOC family protein [Anaerolineales bacterium]|nr:VOC family protein [Anaerolineales bacterium]MCB9126946.1 VOC family protein [Ardenticatenales bacterium]MCB9171491.1 VOC family protein [Ardenticatenales bacterium]
MATPDAMGMVVRDMAATLAFYRLLGLDIPSQMDEEAHAEYETASGFRLMWDSVALVQGFDPSYSPASGHAFALAFRCDSPQEVDDLYHKALAAGHEGHLEPWDAFWGQRYATLRDPDGNAVDLYAPLS